MGKGINRDRFFSLMKALIVYVSYHHGNTEVIVNAIGGVLKAEMRSPASAKPEQLRDYDLVGFASGNYFGKFDKRLMKFVDNLPRIEGGKAFIFSTSGSSNYQGAHKDLRMHLGDKGFRVVGVWNCRAFDSFGPLRLLGGINKGKPDEGDIASARRFAEGLLENNR
jgi:flavodoxin